MKAGERHLNWAFAVALALHGLALLAAARLPAEPARTSDLEDIQVFDKAAPVMVAPVDLVEWTQLQQPVPEAHVSLPVVPERPPAAVRNVPVPRPHPARPTISDRRPTVSRPPTPRPTRGAQVSQPDGGGGGGGGPVDIGAASARGGLSGTPTGRTPVGGLPGAGAGSGSGAGAGSGTGTGEGSGSGSGPGSGSGAGAGAGSGPGGGAGSGAGGAGEHQPFVSRVADRLEPEVVAKGMLSYPGSAQEEGVEGTVKLKVLVTEKGSVAEVQIITSSGDHRLDSAAKEWVRGWRYRPAFQDGKPRRVYTHAAVQFELR